MKIKLDFITNSSSTSFVIVSYEEFDLKTFMETVGVKDTSLFKDIYQRLFYAFKEQMEPAREFVTTCRWRNDSESFESFILRLYSQKTLDKILDAEKAGLKVYMGWLHSDNDETECFFCTDSFIIDTNKLYIDASVDGW
ncbi:MAG: hypothetical protein Q8M92_03945 [Candidatus Subteraquimicrobiales bacterium]|nr:hypothetical protein [Candidatus Subteraquimicrobiales bacterium]